MSNRATEYRQILTDVVDSGLLDEDEWQQIGDLLKNVEVMVRAKMAKKPEEDAA